MFLPGTPFDPPRAGTRARTRPIGAAVSCAEPAAGAFCTNRTSRNSAATDRPAAARRRRGVAGRHDVADVQVVGGVVGAHDLEAGARAGTRVIVSSVR